MTTPSLPESIQIETAPAPKHAVIWLHGLGADGHDFEPLVPALHIPPHTPLRFVFPHAPLRPVTINGNAEMRAWYDITDLNLERQQDRDGIEQSAALLREMIEREGERGIPASRVILAGFSQGGAVALHTGLRFPQPLAAIIALSAYLPLADSLPAEAAAANRHTPLFIAHGSHDPVVPLHLARRTHRQLTQAGYPVEWREYPIQHHVSPPEIADLADFLRARLSGG